MLRTYLCWSLAALLVSLTSVAHAEIYTWTDEDGNKTYSDQPNPRGQQVTLPPINTLETAVPQMPQGSQSQDNSSEGQTSRRYATLQITSPEDDQAIRANDGIVTLVINTTPPLSPGHILRVNVDGEMRQSAVAGNGQSTQRLTLSELDRGSHDIVAVVTNSQGDVVQQSAGITVHVQRTSILQPGRTGPSSAPQAPTGGTQAP